jgi:hypothetical protein
MSATRSLRTSDHDDDGRATDTGAVAARTPRSDHELQREEFGGFSWGSAFFGWLVAVGIAALLTALLSAVGAAIGLTQLSETEAEGAADTIGIVGGVLLLAVLALAYYAGGYVAGRLARFDGARQGFGVWMFALLVTVVLAVAGVVLGAEYNVLGQLNLPRIPVDEGSLTTGGIVALVLALLVTLGAAIAGGKVGERFHRRVDRVTT